MMETTKGSLSGATNTFLVCMEHPYIRCSATPGDYWMMADDETFPCEICGEPMVECREVRTLAPIR